MLFYADDPRLDKSSFDPTCYCGAGVPIDSDYFCTGPNATQNKLGEWNEWYLDIHDSACKKSVKKVQLARIKAAKAKGCDGVDPDNVDSVSPSFETLLTRVVLQYPNIRYHCAG